MPVVMLLYLHFLFSGVFGLVTGTGFTATSQCLYGLENLWQKHQP